MSAIEHVTFSSICTRQILVEGIKLLNEAKKTDYKLNFYDTPTAITGWLGAKTNKKVYCEITNTKTEGSIGIYVLNHKDEKVIPDANGNFMGTMNLVGDHIYIDQALGRKGCQLQAACDTARHILVARENNVPVKSVEYVAKKNEFLVELEMA